MERFDRKLTDRLYRRAGISGLLDCLDNVRKAGEGYRAKCPAHDGESTNSLSICESDDGKVLLKCWGGCDVHQVLDAVGLTINDLFPERITPDMTPQQQRQVRAEISGKASLSRAKAAASALELEANVVGIFGRKLQSIHEGKCQFSDMAEGDIARFHLAQDRIFRIKEDLHGL